MIALTIHDNNEDHFVVRGDEPFRIEVTLVSGRILAHVYSGCEDDLDQEPEGAYDGTAGVGTDWRSQDGKE